MTNADDRPSEESPPPSGPGPDGGSGSDPSPEQAPAGGETGAAAPGADESAEDAPAEREFLSWPPPGLRRLQGDLWQITKETGLGSLLLVLPLLWAVASEQEFWSLGPFGASWWVVLLTSAVGLAILVNGFVDLFRLFRRVASATDRGYGWMTVAMVAADSERDAGFLLQGARIYSVLEPKDRRGLVFSRLVAGAAYLTAVFWLPLGFALGVLLAARGSLAPSSLALFTLTPAALLLVGGLLLRIRATRLEKKAKRKWFQQPWSQDLAEDEVGSWNRTFEALREPPVPGTGADEVGSRFRVGAGVVLGLAAIVFVPVLTLVFTTAAGPVLASVALPDFTATQRRAGSVEAYRRYQLPADSSTTPQRAGALYHGLTFAGVSREPEDLERPPEVRYEQPWMPDLRGGPTGIFPARWSNDLIRRAPDGMSPEERAFLQDVADHPALADIRELARAPALDVGSARWTLPFPEGTSYIDLPIPKLSPVRQASWAMVGTAALAAAEGRLDDAERTLRELVSVGFLLGDDAPSPMENLVGFMLVETGGEALENFYAATGRTEEAEALRSARQATDRTARMALIGAGSDVEGTLRQIPSLVESAAGVRGLRWEHFALMNTLAPCLNSHKMVFGPGQEYEGWVGQARRNLVRWPSEQALFELTRNGYFAGAGGEGGGALGALLGFTLGGQGEIGSCASFLTAAQEEGILF